MTPQPDLASIKASLLASLPLNTEQREQYDELLPQARSVASNLLTRWKRHRWLVMDDLYSQAAVFLEEAIRTFDPTKSPNIKGWVGKFVSWRLRTWLRNELREHGEYKPLIKRQKKETATEQDCFLTPHDKRTRRKAPRDVRLADDSGMKAGAWDHSGSYRDNPLHRLIAEEIAVAVRRTFEPRDVAIYVDKLSGHDTEDLARKHYLTPQRINQIVADIREYIAEQIKDSGIPIKQVVTSLIEYSVEGREQVMRMLGYSEEEIRQDLEKSEKSIFQNGYVA